MTNRIKWTLLAVVLSLLSTSDSQNARSYENSEWIPITKSPNDDAPLQKKATGRVLNLSQASEQNDFLSQESRTKDKKTPVVEQYLRETTPQNVRQPVRFPEARPKEQYYLIPKQQERLYLPEATPDPYPKRQELYDPNSFFIHPPKPLNLTLAPYQSLRPDTINQELIATLNKPASTQIISTTPRINKEEKETVQLLYVPVETLTPKRDNQPQRQDWSEETRRQPQLVAQHPSQQRLHGIQNDFVKQALEAHRLQMQLQAGSVPVAYATTLRPLIKRRRPHQPPLSLYMGGSHDIDVAAVLEELKHADTIAVQDSVGPETPKVFVGPSNLDVPNTYSKFELPYLSSIESNRIQRKVDHLPFFVAPLSYKTPPGYSKIPLPAPHVGSVVVSLKGPKEIATTTRKPLVVEEDEDDTSEERPLYRYVPKYRKPSKTSEVDDEINRRQEKTESLFENQSSKKQPVSLTVKSRSSTSITPHQESGEADKATSEEHRPKPKTYEESQEITITTSKPKGHTYSFEEPQEIRVTSERPSKPEAYHHVEREEITITSERPAKPPKTYSFEDPQPVRVTSERPSRPRTYSFEEPPEATSVRPSRPRTYSFEEPQEITSVRPLKPRTYSFEEPQEVTSARPSRPSTYSYEEPQAATENPRPQASRTKQYSTAEEPEKKQQNYRHTSHEEQDDDEEETTRRQQPQRTVYSTTEGARRGEKEPRGESEASHSKPKRVNTSEEDERDEEPVRRRKPARKRYESEESPAPKRQSAEERDSRPAKEGGEEKEESVSERKDRPTKLTFDDPLYQSAPSPQGSYEDTKAPYQTSNRFVSTTPVYVLRTTDNGNERPSAYLVEATDYSPTPKNYENQYVTLEEFRAKSSTPRYSFEEEEPHPIYSITTGRPQVAAISEAPSYESKFSPYSPSPYDLTDKKPSGPNPYELQPTRSGGLRDRYNFPAQLPPINPEIPGLINNLQDQSVRQLLVPGLLVPTTEHEPVYTRSETTTPEYAAVTTTPEPIVETTTQKRARSRQRGGSRFSLPVSRDSEEVTSPPRRTLHRQRRPQLRQRGEHRREEHHEQTTEYTPARINEYSTTEASRRDITHSPRQRVRSRTRAPHHHHHEETKHVEESHPRTPEPPPPQSYVRFEQDQTTQHSGEYHQPVSEVRDYGRVYGLQESQEASTIAIADSHPTVLVTDSEEHSERLPLQQHHTEESSKEETVRRYEEPTTTPRAKSRSRPRSRTRVAASAPSTTRKPITTTTSTEKPQAKQEEEPEFYGFIRPPSYNKPKLNRNFPAAHTETPAYSEFDKRFKIPSYTFDFPSYYHSPTTQSHEDYYKELEAAGREPIQLYTNDKHLSTTPLYVFKPKYILQTEDQQNVAATADPLRQSKEDTEEKTKTRAKVPQRKKPEEEQDTSTVTRVEGLRRDGSKNNEVAADARKEASTVNKNSRTRGRTHFQLPASLRTASEEAEVQGGNYPAEFLQRQASVTQPPVFQITVEPPVQDSEVDQQPFSSIQRPSIALPDQPNALSKKEETKEASNETSTAQPTQTPTTISEDQTNQGKKRGVWKLVKQRPLDNFEAAESQNYHAAVQVVGHDPNQKESSDKSNLFDALYEMFSSPEKDEASTEANTAQPTTLATSSEEEVTTAAPITETTTVAAEATNSTVTTETVEVTTGKALKPYEVEPWEMKAIKTSTTTEVSHETEICFRGRCVKSSGIAKTP